MQKQIEYKENLMFEPMPVPHPEALELFLKESDGMLERICAAMAIDSKYIKDTNKIQE
jgi:hypothetical protein